MRICIVYFAALAATCLAQSLCAQPAKVAPVASVDGQLIFEDELAPLVEGQLRQLQYQEYQVRRKALDDLINQKLVAAKAKEKGLASEEFLRQEIDNKLPEPGEAEVEASYFAQRNLSNVPFELVKRQLLADLKQKNARLARQDYIQRLRQSADVSVMLRPPRVQVSFDPARTLGSSDAPITIVEFADFQCPYCRKATPTMREVLNKYKGQVRLAFRDFPLQELHPYAQRAAEAARCATAQGKFWAYHDVLFSGRARLSEQDLREHAVTLNLDMTQFDACMQDGRFKALIEEDLKAGVQAGVSGTPGFFINGVFLNGWQSLSAFESVIDEELLSLKGQGK
jgi:protein-disulfide isomerase